MILPTTSLDPATGVITLTECEGMSVEAIERHLDALWHLLDSQQEHGTPAKLLIDARHKSFTDLEAQRTFSIGLREILAGVIVAKVAVVGKNADEAHEALSLQEPRLRWFVDRQRAHTWLTRSEGAG